jgi:hypothetical protein
VFTKDGVTVYKEEDVLITCKGEPILIGVRDMHGRYRIPLVQQQGLDGPQQWHVWVFDNYKQYSSYFSNTCE